MTVNGGRKPTPARIIGMLWMQRREPTTLSFGPNKSLRFVIGHNFAVFPSIIDLYTNRHETYCCGLGILGGGVVERAECP